MTPSTSTVDSLSDSLAAVDSLAAALPGDVRLALVLACVVVSLVAMAVAFLLWHVIQHVPKRKTIADMMGARREH